MLLEEKTARQIRRRGFNSVAKRSKSWFRARSVANRLHIIICSTRAPFSVAHFVISGGYYRRSFESVIESIVRLQLQNEAPYLTSHNA